MVRTRTAFHSRCRCSVLVVCGWALASVKIAFPIRSLRRNDEMPRKRRRDAVTKLHRRGLGSSRATKRKKPMNLAIGQKLKAIRDEKNFTQERWRGSLVSSSWL